MVEDGADVGFVDEGAGWVAGAAEVDEFYAWVGGEGGVDEGWLGAEGVAGVQGDFDDPDVVHLRRDRVHAVGGWAGEDFVAARGAEGAEQGVDCFVAAYAYEEVGGGEGFGGVGVGVAEVDEGLF